MAKKKTAKSKDAPALQTSGLPEGYGQFLEGLKDSIRTTQLKAAVAVNRELVGLYWQIGKGIVERQRAYVMGNAVVDRLGRDLQSSFPGLSGFSRTNVYRMRAFYLAYPGPEEIVPQPVGRISETALPVAVEDIP